MILIWLILGVVAALLLFSRVATLLIDRRWPPVGTMVDLGGLRLHLLDKPGPPDAPVLLLIHGASGNFRDQYEALGDALAGRFRIIAIDRPGNGHTDRGPIEMSDPSRQADLIAEALDAIGIGSCLVLGHSLGAATATAMALRHPSRIGGLVLIAPASHPWPSGVSHRTRLFARPYVGRILAELLVIPLGLRLAPRVLRLIFYPEAIPPGYAKRIGALLAIRPASFVANCRDIVDLYPRIVRLSARYGEIDVPTEVIACERDYVVPPAIHAYALARDIPGARLIVLPGAGHMPHWTRTTDVLAAVERVAADSAERTALISPTCRPGR